MANNLLIPPALVMIGGAILIPFLGKKIRAAAFLFFTAITLYLVLTLPEGAQLGARLMNYSLVLLKVDSLSRIFGMIFAFIALAGGIYSFHIKDTGQQTAAMLYAGGALGVTFAGDFFTLFIYWEMMAVASTYLIWARRTVSSQKAGFRYLLYHVLGGGLLFSGILLHVSSSGSIQIVKVLPQQGLPAWLMLLGVAINAAVPPLHAWLSDAYPKATVTGAVFLSAFTTKSAVYVLVRVFPGWEILFVFGVIMTLYGVFFAVLANDIRGILAYHIISQVGYMVAGVGIGTEMALNGTTAHAFSHILYKALLFMGAGVVLHSTGKSKLTELGGLFRQMPKTFWLYMIAAFSISGFPLFNGFISKSMVVSAAGAAHLETGMLLLNLAAVGTFLSVGLKLPYFTWFGKKSDLKPAAPPRNMLIGMAVVATLCFLYGIAPGLLYRFLPFPVDYHPYTVPHLVEAVQMLAFTFIAFWLLRKVLKPKATIALDIDWFYRRPAVFLRKILVDPVDHFFSTVEKLALSVAGGLAAFGRNPQVLFKPGERGSDYDPQKSRPATENILAWVLILFAVMVFLAFLI